MSGRWSVVLVKGESVDINNGAYATSAYTGASYTMLPVNGLFQLQKGDTIEVRFNADSDTNFNLAAYCTFTGAKLAFVTVG